MSRHGDDPPTTPASPAPAVAAPASVAPAVEGGRGSGSSMWARLWRSEANAALAGAGAASAGEGDAALRAGQGRARLRHRQGGVASRRPRHGLASRAGAALRERWGMAICLERRGAQGLICFLFFWRMTSLPCAMI